MNPSVFALVEKVYYSSHTRLRQLADFPSLILRLSFAYPSLILRLSFAYPSLILYSSYTVLYPKIDLR
ncbi:MAG: hypothetical protein HG435_002890 [Capnocytophaga sp.]|nr:hypothetical protein [Capnocytophaga sp.]MBB1547164.1 hypothetical protein [Capnocytophaga sp.]MBB1568443.1 hypothetical protein [Capnocytophaga sp.]